MVQKSRISIQEFKISKTLANRLNHVDLTPKIHVFLEDFKRLLEYCKQNNGLVLLPFSSYFPRDAVAAMNQLLHDPDSLGEKITQLNTSFVHYFYCAAWFMNLFDIAPGLKFMISDRAMVFSACTTLQQFIILFDSLWNKTRWHALQGNPSGRPDGVQEYRNQLAYFLGRVNAGVRTNFRTFLSGSESEYGEDAIELTCLDTLDFTMRDGVFPTRIMPLLKRMDLVDFEYAKPGEMHASRHYLEISWFQVTPVGKKIFRSVGNLREPRAR